MNAPHATPNQAEPYPPAPVLSAAEEAARRRRIRNTALRLTLFAIVVYVGFIIAFINRHS
jgi:hypothetical protein